MPHQQSSVGRTISIILVSSRTNQLGDLLPLVGAILLAVDNIQPGQTITIAGQCLLRRASAHNGMMDRPRLAQLEVTIVRFVDEYQPGIITCEFLDAKALKHTLVDKVPIFSVVGD
jgi:hypothetical protein